MIAGIVTRGSSQIACFGRSLLHPLTLATSMVVVLEIAPSFPLLKLVLNWLPPERTVMDAFKRPTKLPGRHPRIDAMSDSNLPTGSSPSELGGTEDSSTPTASSPRLYSNTKP